jgi:non-homologous end joining protein Ku
VIDLMAALKKSVGGKEEPATKAPAKKAAPAKKRA